MDQSYPDFVLGKIPVETGAPPDQVIDFAGQFDPAESSANDYERQIKPAPLWVLAGFRLLQLLNDVDAEAYRISHRLERERVVAHSGNHAQIAVRATGNYKVIVIRPLDLALIVLVFNLARCSIDAVYALGSALYSRQHLPERRRCGIRVDGGSRNISQERVKHHVVFFAEQENVTIVWREFSSQSFCAFGCGKTAANNYNPCLIHRHLVPTIVLSEVTVVCIRTMLDLRFSSSQENRY
jgi:hypothetical protein